MKKVALIMAAVALCGTMFTSCAEKFTCDVCGEEQNGKKNVVSYMGETATLCDTCNELFNIGVEAMGDLDIDLGDFGY